MRRKHRYRHLDFVEEAAVAAADLEEPGRYSQAGIGLVDLGRTGKTLF